MRVIALDSTTRTGSVALLEGDRIVEERRGDGSRSHAERLPMELVALADTHHVALRDIDVYAVASGPGSFTGLRIGIATVQGLAFVHGRSVFSVSALEALAHAASAALAPGTVMAAGMAAHRRDVFAAAYRVAAAPLFSPGRLEELDPPGVDAPASILERWTAQLPALPAVFVGDGAELYRHEVASAVARADVIAAPLLAGTIGRLAAARTAQAVDPAAIRPLYVLRPHAATTR